MYSPKFVITNKILKNIGAIEASKEVIENAPLVPSYEKQFQSDAIVRTVYHGTHIEGNDLTLIQTRKILEGEDVYGRARDIQEVINYRNVATLLDELVTKRGGYEPDMVRDMHKLTVYRIIPEDKIGVFRTSQVVIKESGSGKVIFEPPPWIEVNFLIEDFFNWFNSPEALEIHPFVEGNGRVSRAFATLVLIREGYDIKKFFSLEEHFDDDPASYYEAFAMVDRQSKNIAERNLTPWLEYFTEVVAVELSKIKEKVRKLSIDTKLKVKIGEQIALSERQMRLVEYVSDQGSASMGELRKVLSMVSEDTILRDLTDMLKKGIIKKEGSTKASRYVVANK